MVRSYYIRSREFVSTRTGVQVSFNPAEPGPGILRTKHNSMTFVTDFD